MAGMKRAADGDPSPRPTKIRRLGTGPSDVVRAMELHLQMNAASEADRAVPEPGIVFLNATSAAVSAFDWSELVSALDAQEFWTALRADDDRLLVDVPGAVRRVRISKRLILKEIVDRLGLKVFGYGIAMEDDGVLRGCLDMEIPSSRSSCAAERRKFFSDDAFSRHEAMEGACDAAISHLRTACFVVVEDINYEEVRSLQRRALAAETWSDLLNGALEGGRKNKKAILSAYTSFFLEAKGLCKEFGDVFGVGTIGMAGTSAAPDEEKVYYGGPRPPITRAEQLAFGLVDLINRGAEVVMTEDDVM